jgi:hypothetical protein
MVDNAAMQPRQASAARRVYFMMTPVDGLQMCCQLTRISDLADLGALALNSPLSE